jgi:hypothetical protein
MTHEEEERILDVNRMLRNFNNDQLRDLFAVVNAIAEERARPAREFMADYHLDNDGDCIGCGGQHGAHTPDCYVAAEIAKLPKVTT